MASGSTHVAWFHHATNDILQTADAKAHGMDTTELDWWPHERQVIESMAVEHYVAGPATLDQQ